MLSYCDSPIKATFAMWDSQPKHIMLKKQRKWPTGLVFLLSVGRKRLGKIHYKERKFSTKMRNPSSRRWNGRSMICQHLMKMRKKLMSSSDEDEEETQTHAFKTNFGRLPVLETP